MAVLSIGRFCAQLGGEPIRLVDGVPVAGFTSGSADADLPSAAV